MAIYTYADFEKAAAQAGLLDGFSSADLRLAQQNPDAGMSLLKYMKDYTSGASYAKSTAEKAMNQIRSDYGGYTEIGGSMVLNKPSIGSFNYDSPYSDRIGALTEALANRKPFEYDAENDPNMAAQRKAYLRDSKRATSDAVAEASAMTGGIPSSYAITAGTQAGDYHASQFADKYTELYNAAYNKYINDHSMNLSELEVLKNAEDADRNFEYTKHVNSFSDSDASSGSSYSYGSGSSGSYYPTVNTTGNSIKANISSILPAPSVSENKTETNAEDNTDTSTTDDNSASSVIDLLPKPSEITKGDTPISSVSGTTAETEGETAAEVDNIDSTVGEKTVADFKNTTLAMQYIDSKMNEKSGDRDQRPNVVEERDWQRYKQQAKAGSLPAGANNDIKTAASFDTYEDYLNYLFKFVG